MYSVSIYIDKASHDSSLLSPWEAMESAQPVLNRNKTDENDLWDPSRLLITSVVANDFCGPTNRDYVEGQFDFRLLHDHLTKEYGPFLPSTVHQAEVARRTEPTVDPNVSLLEEPPTKRRRTAPSEIRALDWTHFIKPNYEKPIGGGGYGDVYMMGRGKIYRILFLFTNSLELLLKNLEYRQLRSRIRKRENGCVSCFSACSALCLIFRPEVDA